MMNQKAFDALPENLRAALLKAHAETGRFSAELMGKAADESITRMKQNGVTFVEIDRKPFIESMAGFYQVHLGVILQLALLIGIATPPMGIGLYIMVEVAKVPFEKITVAVLPFLIPLIVVLVLITYVPALTLWLPDLVLGPDTSIIMK